MEMNLGSHDGGNASRDFAYTLTLTDVATGWTELHALPNRAQEWVLEALPALMDRLPFPLKGLDSDNGSEFINHHLTRFCADHGITFTRSRSEDETGYTLVFRSMSPPFCSSAWRRPMSMLCKLVYTKRPVSESLFLHRPLLCLG
ncbi:integrase catalytic domain-containing protein [Aminiphilus circumscriptus]|jgi:hypothetical protein|uniref:integrase catalytic domain-containing protein n=1 Tax=Aminiphilus circumscriptus TaxID=290732 RepID=UPI0004B64511|nr:DDE-type integrase/transposase/recombinase [Aminiphilus circumscriptus]